MIDMLKPGVAAFLTSQARAAEAEEAARLEAARKEDAAKLADLERKLGPLVTRQAAERSKEQAAVDKARIAYESAADVLAKGEARRRAEAFPLEQARDQARGRLEGTRPAILTSLWERAGRAIADAYGQRVTLRRRNFLGDALVIWENRDSVTARVDALSVLRNEIIREWPYVALGGSEFEARYAERLAALPVIVTEPPAELRDAQHDDAVRVGVWQR